EENVYKSIQCTRKNQKKYYKKWILSNQREDFDITNDMFQESIPITTKIILDDIPSNDELNHVFSKGCERKMKKEKLY
ncbi:TPA: hypothetical protein ACKOJN_003943, partial [Clostridioides difficile]|nr:hypothetical protein [Clostridioides difficile]